MKISLLWLLPGLLFYTGIDAQLPVVHEPHHKVILQNDVIRILDGHIPAHDTTPAHLHAANSIVVFLSLSTFGIQTTGGSPVVTRVAPGDIKYAAYGDKPVSHLVWNESPSTFHFYVVELLKAHPGSASCPALSQPGLQLQWKQPSVTAYYLQPPAGRQCQLPASKCARLLIDLSGTITATSAGGSHTRQPEGYLYFPPGSSIGIRGDHSRCILLEMQ